MGYCSEDLSRIENYELALDDKEEVWQVRQGQPVLSGYNGL